MNLTLRSMAIQAAIGVGFALLAAPLLVSMAPRVDELTYLSHGLRQVAGAVIYRDFFEFSTPLSSWLAALTLWLGGPSLFAARVVQVVILGLVGWLLYRAGRRLGLGHAFSIMPGLIFVLCQVRVFPVYNHHWIVLPFVWGGLLLAMRGLETRHWGPWVLSGLCAGLAVLTMQSDGLALVAALGLGMAIATRLGGGPWGLVGVRLSGLLAGGLIPVVIAAAYLAWHGALATAYDHIWSWPLQHYRQAGGVNDIKYLMDFGRHGLQFPTKSVNVPIWYTKLYHVGMMYLLPIAGAVGALLWAIGLGWRRLTTNEGLREREGAVGLVAVAAVVFLAVATKGRADYTHAAFYATPAVLLACLWASITLERLRAPEEVAVRWVPTGLLLVFVATGVVMSAADLRANGPLPRSPGAVADRITSGSAYTYLRTHAQPGDRIVSLPAGGFHYFFALPPATRYTLLFPPEVGYNGADDLQTVVQEIRREKPAFVLLSRQFMTPAGLKYLQPGLEDYEVAEGHFVTPGLGETRIYRRKRQAP